MVPDQIHRQFRSASYPNYSNYTGHFAPSLAPHVTFPFVERFAPNFPLSAATATVPYSAAPSSVATSEMGSSQSSLGRNSQGLKGRESANGAKNNAKRSDDQTHRKQAYKDAKTNNSKTVFDEVLSSRPVVRMPGCCTVDAEQRIAVDRSRAVYIHQYKYNYLSVYTCTTRLKPKQ